MVNLFVRLISFETFKKGKKLDPIFHANLQCQKSVGCKHWHKYNENTWKHSQDYIILIHYYQYIEFRVSFQNWLPHRMLSPLGSIIFTFGRYLIFQRLSEYSAANDDWWRVITNHFCILTDQLFLYSTVNFC